MSGNKGQELLLFLFLFLLNTFMLSAQNRADYFKTIPPINNTSPEWVQLMYADDPNVRQVDYEYSQYFKKHAFVKDTDVRNYLHWRRIVESLLDEEGFIRPLDRQSEERISRLLKEKKQQNKQNIRNAGWVSLGPIETYKDGTTTPVSLQTNVYSIDQSSSNTNLLIAGTESGGVFKSTDKGLNWTLISAEEEFVRGITAVKIHPDNPGVFFIAGNNRVYQSVDAGSSWTESFYHGGSVNEIKFFPGKPDTLFCTASNGLYRSNDAGSNWTTVFTDECWDIDFHPTDPTVLYLLKENTSLVRQEIFRSDNSGNTWTLKDFNWYSPSNPGDALASGGKIGVTEAAPNMIYVALIGQEKTDDNGWIGVYRSTDRGENWVNPVGQNGNPYQSANTMPWNIAAYSSGYHQGYYNFDLEVSDNDPGKLWVGTVRLSESGDSAKTWIGVGAANSQRTNNLHADIQDIEVNGNDIWVASDGGINYSNDELLTEESRKKGISASDFWGFGSGWNEDVLVGGKYHNGNSAYYQTYGTGNYMHAGGVEESTGYVSPIDPLTTYFGYGDKTNVRSIPDQLGGSYASIGNLALRPNETYTSSYSSLLHFHPYYADHVFLGKDNTLYQSTNGGYSFDALYSFDVDDRVLEFEIARNNPDVWYCVIQPGGYYWDYCEIYKTSDAGATWSILPSIPAANRWRLEISLNPEDENEIWVSSRNAANGQKVYQSTDGGANWLAKTSSAIDDEKPCDILFQGGTDDLVYLATDNSIFYWESTAGEWVDYGDGLPLIINTLKMRPFYRDGKLRFASYGRGIWEREMHDDFRPLAQPITYTETIQCARDTIAFDCYSILNHSSATWSWTFSPAPLFVSDLNTRNPKVVFGSNGEYSVSLTVTDKVGRMNTKSIPAMVKVVSECEPDSMPHLAMASYAAGDYCQTPDFDRTVENLTITAWVKPDGIQPDYSGIVINDETTAGFNFKNGDNSLAYHWPGGQWWWNSGLIVPEGEWSYVAMVATPTGMTLYVNGESATHSIALDPVTLETMKIGSYKAWSSRNFIGEIDEVYFWDRALNAEEIRELRHLTKEDYSDPNLFAYYQFNESSGYIMDKIGDKHLTLNGNANRTVSSAPLGGGSSAKVAINAAGEYTFPGTGLSMTFPTGATYPDGDLYVSRINLEPYAEPNTNPDLGCYWIINNYGDNATFTTLENISFDPAEGSPTTEVINDPSSVQLYKRQGNGAANDWTSLCSAYAITSGADGEFSFNNTCGINSFSQFYINSNLAPLPIELLDFQATAKGERTVNLNWQAVEETDLVAYELEHATNGHDFRIFKKVNPKSLQQVLPTSYQAEHRQAVQGANYYRLKMINLDGSFQYSPVRVVAISSEKDLVIAPNPVLLDTPLSLRNTKNYRLHFLLYNSNGQLKRNVFLEPNSTVELSTEGLAVGIYFYLLESSSKLEQGKLFITK